MERFYATGNIEITIDVDGEFSSILFKVEGVYKEEFDESPKTIGFLINTPGRYKALFRFMKSTGGDMVEWEEGNIPISKILANFILRIRSKYIWNVLQN